MPPTPLPTLPASLRARGVGLRSRQDEDADFLRDVYVAYRWPEMRMIGWPEAAALAFLHDQHRTQEMSYRANYPGMAWGVVTVDGQPGGRLYLFRSGDALRVADIALLPALRNQGIGAALLAAVQEQARGLGLAVTIHVDAANPAQRLYRRLGFAPWGENPPYVLLKWMAG